MVVDQKSKVLSRIHLIHCVRLVSASLLHYGLAKVVQVLQLALRHERLLFVYMQKKKSDGGKAIERVR